MDCGDVLVCDVSLSFVTLPYGVSDEVWCFIVLIPDLRLSLYVCPMIREGNSIFDLNWLRFCDYTATR